MSDDARAALHIVTLIAVVILGALGHDQLALGVATGTLLPSPVLTAVRQVKERRDGD